MGEREGGLIPQKGGFNREAPSGQLGATEQKKGGFIPTKKLLLITPKGLLSPLFFGGLCTTWGGGGVCHNKQSICANLGLWSGIIPKLKCGFF